MIWVREAFESDIRDVANNMRAEDLEEIGATHKGLSAEQVLTTSFRNSRIYRKVFHEQGYGAVAMYGLAGSPLDTKACIWFLGTERMRKHRKWFLRTSFDELQKMKALRPFLYNMIDSRYTMSLRWLKWLGFDLQENVLEFDGVPFHMATMEDDDNERQQELFGLDAVGYPNSFDAMPGCVRLFEHENSKVRREPASHTRKGVHKR